MVEKEYHVGHAVYHRRNGDRKSEIIVVRQIGGYPGEAQQWANKGIVPVYGWWVVKNKNGEEYLQSSGTINHKDIRKVIGEWDGPRIAAALRRNPYLTAADIEKILAEYRENVARNVRRGIWRE